MAEDFELLFSELLDKTITANRDRVWEKAVTDLEDVVAAVNRVIHNATKGALALKLEKSPHPIAIQSVYQTRYDLILTKVYENNEPLDRIGMFIIPKNGHYPVTGIGGTRYGDRKALEMIMFGMFGNPTEKLIDLIRQISDACLLKQINSQAVDAAPREDKDASAS